MLSHTIPCIKHCADAGCDVQSQTVSTPEAAKQPGRKSAPQLQQSAAPGQAQKILPEVPVKV